ncbi:MAG: hypothetical protein HYV47_01130 [Candidatus Nealsonbacteria bacterium]|nr:hypothetical protein [Candidatus Nealsonbacteria bacterium]
MEKSLSWREALKRSRGSLWFWILIGVWLSYILTVTVYWIAGLIVGVATIYLVAHEVRLVKREGIIVCPRCERELSVDERKYKFSLCCKKEITIN